MDDERLIRSLRAIDAPGTPRPEFVEALFGTLAMEVGHAETSRTRQRVQRPTRSRWALVWIAAAVVATLAALAMIGGIRLPTIVPPSTTSSPMASSSATASPTALASIPASTSPGATPTAASTPSTTALRGSGLVVFEHLDLPKLTPSRLEYLAPDGIGHDLLPDVPGLQEGPAWSPDGSRLAYAGFDPSQTQQETLWFTDVTGATPQPVKTGCELPDCVRERDPSFSPDGGRLAFVRTHGQDGQPTATVVAILDLSKGTVAELESTTADSHVVHIRRISWSGDGSTLAFGVVPSEEGREGLTSVSIVNVDGSGLRQLTPSALEAGDPAWSLDGTLILVSTRPIHAYQVSDPKTMNVLTIRPDGSNTRRIDPNGGAGSATWSADGTQVLFTTVTGYEPDSVAGLGAARPNFTVMSADGTGVVPLTAYRSCCRWYAVQQPTP